MRGRFRATLRRTMHIAASFVEPQTLEVEDLVPASKSGSLMKQWVGERRLFGQPLTGSMLMQVPKEAHVGQGTYGVVWRAQHRETKEVFAVKNVLPSESSNTQRLAARERAVSERVLAAPHPCLVRLMAVRAFDDNGLLSLVMEFCPGGDMLDVIGAGRIEAKRKGSFYKTPEGAHAWIGQVYLGIEHLHRMDVLHRDVKPENVVFAADGIAKLTDFGFGRLAVKVPEKGNWSFSAPTGTPGYTAPEILKQQPHDQRADLYSLGVLVWVLVTGGLTNSISPAPPKGRPIFANDFQAFANDWQRLTTCISAPEDNHSRPLARVASDFILGLVQGEPLDRFGHSEIRNHNFMAALELPGPDAATSAVQAWLQRARRGEVGSTPWIPSFS